MSTAYTLLVCSPAPAALEAAGPWGEFALEACADLGAVAARLGDSPFDAVLLTAGDAAQLARLLRWPSLVQAARDAALVLRCDAATPAQTLQLFAVGVQDLRPLDEDGAALARTLRLAVERQRLHARLRDSGSTDLGTGLPHRAQLLEHMTQLLALREREPAPMALLVLSLGGLAAAEAGLGAVATQILRRKAAVRLRSALRASDVVAVLERDSFAVLLAWIDQPMDGARVAAKLQQALQRPLRVAGQQFQLAVSAGVGLYPAQGRDAASLLRAASHEAAQGGAAALPAATAANDDAA